MEAGKNSAAEYNNAAETEQSNAGSPYAADSSDEGSSSSSNEEICNNNDGERGQCRRPEMGLIPLDLVSRVIKSALPPEAEVSPAANQAVYFCLSEYISYIASKVNDRSQSEMRNKICVEDIVRAHATLGFGTCVGPPTAYFKRFRQSVPARGTGVRVKRTSDGGAPISSRGRGRGRAGRQGD